LAIVTDEATGRRASSPADGADRVQRRFFKSSRDQVSSGRESVTLNQSCVVYRSTRPARRIVQVVPLRSIESFHIRLARPYWLFALACLFYFSAIVAGLWLYGIPMILAASRQAGAEVNLQVLRIPGGLLICAILLTVAHALSLRAELVIHTVSGLNPIHLLLSRKLAVDAEAFVGEIEAQIERTFLSTLVPPGSHRAPASPS
jgi:hypothetical protein